MSEVLAERRWAAHAWSGKAEREIANRMGSEVWLCRNTGDDVADCGCLDRALP